MKWLYPKNTQTQNNSPNYPKTKIFDQSSNFWVFVEGQVQKPGRPKAANYKKW